MATAVGYSSYAFRVDSVLFVEKVRISGSYSGPTSNAIMDHCKVDEINTVDKK